MHRIRGGDQLKNGNYSDMNCYEAYNEIMNLDPTTRCVSSKTSENVSSHQDALDRKKRKEARREEQRIKLQSKANVKKEKQAVLYTLPFKPDDKKDTSCPLPSAYSVPYTEAVWYDWWEAQGYFKQQVFQEGGCGKPFVVCLPPPNVTGQLHLGHALGNSIQDAVVRWHRMNGYKVLWNPGTDHAGIATQVRVERQLWQKEKKSRHDLGREAFIERVWQWKNEKGSTISEQMRRLGSSLDWSRDCFTMDPKMCVAVNEAFIRLFDEDLIYRNKRLVNWSCTLKSAISDLEVDYKEVEGKTRVPVPGYEKPVEFGVLTDFAFPVLGTDEEIIVSTTRPETVLGDTAVAIHPTDGRYSHLHGKHVQHPLCERIIPIVCDKYVDQEFGTGAVKITPGHDPNDHQLGLRHQLPVIDILSDDGRLINVPEKFVGLPRFEARRLVVEALKQIGVYRGEKKHSMKLPICSRSGDVIEPRVKDQWYVDCTDMAAKAVQAVKDKRLQFIPEGVYENSWNDWLTADVTRDWCISRQLWWGHRVPAYHVTNKNGGESRGWVAAQNQDGAIKKACDWLKCRADDIDVTQDPDVLDTWFSSALFPFAIFGWPEKTADLETFYPTQLLETANDIMFFWVARMVMLGEKLTGKLPFDKVLYHGILRDHHGRKMSKSLGNVVDPMHVVHGISLEDLHKTLEKESFTEKEMKKAREGQRKDFPGGIPECGSDALRFTMCSMRFKSHFVNVDIAQVQNNRFLCNKIYQIFSFIHTLLQKQPAKPYTLQDFSKRDSQLTATDRWLLCSLSELVQSCDEAFRTYDLHLATTALNAFWREVLSGVYLEYAKLVLQDKTSEERDLPNIEKSRLLLLMGLDSLLRQRMDFGLIKEYVKLAIEDAAYDEHTELSHADIVRQLLNLSIDEYAKLATEDTSYDEDKEIPHAYIVRHLLHLSVDVGLRCLTPFMPFLSEELYQRLPENDACPKAESVIIASYPKPNEFQFPWRKDRYFSEMELVRNYSNLVTSLRYDLQMRKPKQDEKQVVYIHVTNVATLEILQAHKMALTAMMNCSDVIFNQDQSEIGKSICLETPQGHSIYVEIEGFLDIPRQQSRLSQDAESLQKRKESLESKLEISPEEKCHVIRDDLALINGQLTKVQGLLKTLEQLLPESGPTLDQNT